MGRPLRFVRQPNIPNEGQPDAAGFSEGRWQVLSPEGALGPRGSIMFLCDDAVAIWREAVRYGIQALQPFEGNGMWVTSLGDPDGYIIEFESATDAPEDTVIIEDKVSGSDRRHRSRVGPWLVQRLKRRRADGGLYGFARLG